MAISLVKKYLVCSDCGEALIPDYSKDNEGNQVITEFNCNGCLHRVPAPDLDVGTYTEFLGVAGEFFPICD